MANEEPAGKIGIGPEYRIGALIQFIAVVALGLLFAVYLPPPEFLVLKYAPWAMVMLVVLVHLCVQGGCWPFSPPEGSWVPGKSRFVPGIGMSVIWMALTFGLLFFMMYVYPKWPLSPLFVWFGTIAFWMVLFYGINWDTWPFKGKMHSWATMIASYVVIVTLSAVIWNFTNLAGTPFADSPFDPKGPVNMNWLSGFLLWGIAWFTVFSPAFTMQGTPFCKLGKPAMGIAQTVLAHVLAYVCWSGTLAMGVPPTFSSCALAGSLIFVAYVHSWMFNFWGVTQFTGAMRAFAALALQIVLAGVWILVARIILGPYAATAAELKLPTDINILTLLFSLDICLPALIAHNCFWLRAPLTLPMPPGVPPPDQAE
jgi:hypothetical protein